MRRYRLDKLEIPEVEELEPKIRRKVMREATKAVALKVREVAPDSGRSHKKKLKKSIKYQVLKAGLQGQVAAKAPHAHLVHDGTKPHATTPTAQGGLLHFRYNDRWIKARSTWHPGMKAQPFLTETAEAMRDDIERILREGAEAAIQETLA